MATRPQPLVHEDSIMVNSVASTLFSRYWPAERVERFIRGSMEIKDYPLACGRSAWEALGVDIARHSGDDKERFGWGVTVFVNSLQGYRVELENEYGPDCWAKAADRLADDSRAQAGISFIRQLTASSEDDAVQALRLIGEGRQCVPYALPGGTPTAFGGQDCGIGVLVQVTSQVEEALVGTAAVRSPTQVPRAVVSTDDNVAAPLGTVTIKLLSGKELHVRYRNHAVRLVRQQARFLIHLYAHKEAMATFEESWKYLERVKDDYQKDGYQEDDGGPPSTLRSRRYALNEKLKEGFKEPPRGEDWVVTIEKVGYRLNKSVRWTLLKEGRHHLPEYLRSTRSNDRQHDDDD